jgi:uncharacterized repeat protein (TIGR03803 family)
MIAFAKTFAVLAIAVVVASAAASGRDAYGIIYKFKGSTQGADPQGELLADRSGNLFGVTAVGGAYHLGTIFKIAPDGSETVLYSFKGGATDGAFPLAGLIADKKGNLYGTTADGCGNQNYGSVFRLSVRGTETVIHCFGGYPDGMNPMAALILDKDGNLYGTAEEFGEFGCGTVFKIASADNETTLYAFKGASQGDGCYPTGQLLIGADGFLYGTTISGGVSDGSCFFGSCGTVFKLSMDGSSETVLHAFASGDEGSGPQAGVITDTQGNLYGVTTDIDTEGNGKLFRIDRDGSESTLYSFKGGSDGATPLGTVSVPATIPIRPAA